MDATIDQIQEEEIENDFPPFIRTYKGGRVQRLLGTAVVPPSDVDSHTGVASKDVVISPETGVGARLFLPRLPGRGQKLPVLVFYHGGGFCVETAFSPTYHFFLIRLVAAANVVAVSVDYRRAPEHPLPVAYEDSWVALKWVVSHANGGSEPWLSEHGDFGRLFVGGDSSGANICHDMAVRAAAGEAEVSISGAFMIHPYFWGADAVGREPRDLPLRAKVDLVWKFACPSSTGSDDPRINPMAEGAPSLKALRIKRLLVCVAEEDLLRDRGLFYCDCLKSSGWGGIAESFESEGEAHAFHIFNPNCEKAAALMNRLAHFLSS